MLMMLDIADALSLILERSCRRTELQIPAMLAPLFTRRSLWRGGGGGGGVRLPQCFTPLVPLKTVMAERTAPVSGLLTICEWRVTAIKPPGSIF
jgi:hypothetical protein